MTTISQDDLLLIKVGRDFFNPDQIDPVIICNARGELLATIPREQEVYVKRSHVEVLAKERIAVWGSGITRREEMKNPFVVIKDPAGEAGVQWLREVMS